MASFHKKLTRPTAAPRNGMFTVAILIMGISGICAETLLLRELLLVFYGNELSIGIVLANWLLLESLGSIFLGRRIEYEKRRIRKFIHLQSFFGIFLPLSILLTRLLKGYIFPTPGESLGLLWILCYSLIILAPLSISHGALFTYSCRIFTDLCARPQDKVDTLAQKIGSVYVYETIGTILGGIAITYLLIPFLGSLEIAFGLSVINFVVCILLKRRSIIPYLLAAAFLVFLLSPELLKRIDGISIQRQWYGQRILHSENSIYANIVVSKRENQYTFFSDGVPIITTPAPDIASMEEFIHLPLLLHPQPSDILIIGGGAGGPLFEIQKHPSVAWVDYCELDPLIIKLLKKFPTTLTETELGDKRVHINFIDGRLFLERTSRKYDVIFVGIQSPSDLQVNRLFTREFFALSKSKLKEKGLLVLTLPGSLSYIPEQLRKLNVSILKSMDSVFPFLRLIPGETNLIIASPSDYPSVEEIIQENLTKRDIEPKFLTSSYIEYKLDKDRLEWFKESIKKVCAKSNMDFLPSAVFYNLAYWNAIFSPYMGGFFDVFENLNLAKVITVIGIIFIIILLTAYACLRIRSTDNSSSYILAFAILTSGFAGMIFDLIIIFAFQSLYGYVYQMVGLLTSLFIAGTGTGGYLINRILKRATIGTFLILDLSLIILTLLFALLLTLFNKIPVVILFLLSFTCGFIVGGQFPLANKLSLVKWRNISGTSGLLYGSDLLGGWMAGMIGGTALIPILGISTTCLVVACVKISSILLLLILKRSITSEM